MLQEIYEYENMALAEGHLMHFVIFLCTSPAVDFNFSYYFNFLRFSHLKLLLMTSAKGSSLCLSLFLFSLKCSGLFLHQLSESIFTGFTTVLCLSDRSDVWYSTQVCHRQDKHPSQLYYSPVTLFVLFHFETRFTEKSLKNLFNSSHYMIVFYLFHVVMIYVFHKSNIYFGINKFLSIT